MKAVAIETFQRDKTILTEEIHLLQANVTYLDQLVNRFKSEKRTGRRGTQNNEC